MSGLVAFELELLDRLQGLAQPWLNSFWIGISWIGNGGAVWILLTIALILYPKTRRIGFMCLIGLVFSGIGTNVLLKNFFARPRPFSYNGFKILIEAPLDYSFPSGHTSVAFTFCFIALKQRLSLMGYPVYRYLLALGSAMAMSRLVLYVHFPTDVIASIMVAYLYAVASMALVTMALRLKGKQNVTP